MTDGDGKAIEGGRELLTRKLTGYVLLRIRGENPYSFPYRIYPDTFDNTRLGCFRRSSNFEVHNSQILRITSGISQILRI